MALRPSLRRTAADGVVAALLAAGITQGSTASWAGRAPRPTTPLAARCPASRSRRRSPRRTPPSPRPSPPRSRGATRSGAALAPLALTLAYGRVRLRVHWPTDVLGGAILGVGAGRRAAEVTPARWAGSAPR